MAPYFGDGDVSSKGYGRLAMTKESSTWLFLQIQINFWTLSRDRSNAGRSDSPLPVTRRRFKLCVRRQQTKLFYSPDNAEHNRLHRTALYKYCLLVPFL